MSSTNGLTARTSGLIVLALASGVGSAAVISLTTFFVDGAVAAGTEPGRAGTLLSLGSVAAIATLLGLGWWSDWSGLRRPLRAIGAMLALGGVGLFVLATSPTGGALAGAMLLCFVFGWGWPGLLHQAVSQLRGSSPARSTGLAMTGVFSGGVAGPLGFGALAGHFGYSTAWLVAAGTALLGGALFGVSESLLTTETSAASRDEPWAR